MSEHNGQFSDEAWSVFEDDANAALAGMESALLALEETPEDPEALAGLFRYLHTLKGSSGFLDLTAVATLAHAAEDLVGKAREGAVSLNSDMIDALLTALDQLRRIIHESRHGHRPEHTEQVRPTSERLRALTRGSEPQRTPPSTLDELVEASEALGTALRGIARTGDTDREALRGTTRELAVLLEAGQTFGCDGFVEGLRELAAALSGGSSRTLVLLWRLAHRRLQADAEGGLVLFGEDPTPPPLQDPAVVFDLVESLRVMLAQLIQSLGRAGDGDAEAGAQLCASRDELAEACRVVGAEELGERLPTGDELRAAAASGAAAARSALSTFVAQADTCRIEWCEAAGLSPGDCEPFADVWMRADETKPRAQQPSGSPAAAPAPPAVARQAEGGSVGSRSAARDGGPAIGDNQASPFLRVESARVEHLMALAGEIGLATGSVFNLPAFANAEIEGLQTRIDRVEGLIRELQDATAGLGLVPIGSVFNTMNRLVRDLGRGTGKKLSLRIEGGDTEIDRVLVDAVRDPLIHLIRNAADHGIEDPEVRQAAGKPATGVITLSAKQQGDNVIISVRDDGQGMRRSLIIACAVEHGLITEEAAEHLSDRDVWALAFEAGFSTAASVSNLSGRGVGMDVVRTVLQSHRGRALIDSAEGRGTVVRMVLPLTLAFLDALVVRVGSSFYVIPVTAVQQVFRAGDDNLLAMKSEGVHMVRSGKAMIPVVALEEFFSDGETTLDQEHLLHRLVVVVQTARGKIAIPIDELVGHEQVTMKALTGHLSKIRAGAACGLLRSGAIAIALDCERLADARQADAA